MMHEASTTFQPVEDWLRRLGLLHYAQVFYDNGYEDIDTIKQIKENDLDAIGIKGDRDRGDILKSVNDLNENLYFELERQETVIERTKIDKIKLKSLLKNCLEEQNTQLTEPPYFNPDGTLGDLYPLAIRLSDELKTHFEDVHLALDELRNRQLPMSSYNQINEIPTSEDGQSVSELPAYLDVATQKKVARTLSFSKNDPRVTKSTTDLSAVYNAAMVEDGKVAAHHAEKRSLFSSILKKKKKEHSKAGLQKQNSNNGREDSSPENRAVQRDVKLHKSMIKRDTNPTFYTDEDSDFHHSKRSASLAADINSTTRNSGGSTSSGGGGSGGGFFNSIRSSLRKKNKDSTEKDCTSPSSGSTSSSENLVEQSHLSPATRAKYAHLAKSEEGSTESFEIIENINSSKPTPPLPPRLDLAEEKQSAVAAERKPSLKIQSLEKYQDEAAKRNEQQPTAVRRARSVTGAPTTVTMNISPPVAPPRKKKPTTPVVETKNIEYIENQMDKLVQDLNTDYNALDYIPPVKVLNKPKLPPRPPARNELKKVEEANKDIKKEKPVISMEQKSKNRLTGSTLDAFDNLAQELSQLQMTELKNKKSPPLNRASPNLYGSSPGTISISETTSQTGSMERRRQIHVPFEQIVMKKLKKDEIFLNEEPYTQKNGTWGVPIALLKRYEKELKHPIEEVATTFDKIRTKKRVSTQLPVVAMELSKIYVESAPPTSLDDWLIYVGLPMFADDLSQAEIDSVHELSSLSYDELKQISVCDDKHMQQLLQQARLAQVNDV